MSTICHFGAITAPHVHRGNTPSPTLHDKYSLTADRYSG